VQSKEQKTQRKKKRKKNHKDTTAKKTESEIQKNLSNFELTTDQVNLLSRGLKFVPTLITNETALRKQLLTDFKDFARRMRLQYIYHGEDNNIHPFYVNSNWEPPVQTSQKLKQITEELYQGGYVGEMTVEWLPQTPNPPRVPASSTVSCFRELPGRN